MRLFTDIVEGGLISNIHLSAFITACAGKIDWMSLKSQTCTKG